jgi:hypothetical protein
VHFFLNFPILTIFENIFPYFMDEHLAALDLSQVPIKMAANIEK